MSEPGTPTVVHEIPVRSQATLFSSRGSIFHSTTRSNLSSICADGIRGDCEKSYRGATEQFIKQTLDDSDASLPVDRQNAVYCWPTLDNPFVTSDSEVILEIDFNSLETPVFAADFSLGTDVVCGYEESEFLHGVPPEENNELQADVRAYAESVSRVETWEEVLAARKRCDYAELLVAGRIPPESITTIGLGPDSTDDRSGEDALEPDFE